MNALILSLSEDEQIAIGNELERLFIFQDKPLKTEKKSLFIQAMNEWGIPARAIVSGLRKLMNEDLKSLKLSTIKEASHEFVHKQFGERSDCDACGGTGTVAMKDEAHREYAFACLCSNGNHFRTNQKLVTWDGENFQILHGNTFKLRFS